MNEKLYELMEKVRATAIQVGGTAADAAYVVGQKASELLDVAKANVKLAGLKADVNVALRETGELIYATHTGNPTDSDVLLAKLQEIDALKTQIAELEAALGKEAAPALCPTCGASVADGAVFCGECGGQL